MKIIQKILLLGLLVAMQSFALQAMEKSNFSNDSDNEKTNLDNNDKKRKNKADELFKKKKKLKVVPTNINTKINNFYKKLFIYKPIRLVFENFYVLPQGAAESKEERNDEDESENYVKVDFYEDIPSKIALLSGYIKGALDFKPQQKSLGLENVSFFHEIKQHSWKEIYHLMTKAYDIKSRLEETKSRMKEDKYEYDDIDLDVDYEITRYMYLYMQERYKNEETNFFVSMFDLVTFLDIPLIAKPLHFLIFNGCCDEGQSPINIERYDALTYRLTEFNDAIDLTQNITVQKLVNKNLLPQTFFHSYYIDELVEHFNHPMMKQFKHVGRKFLKNYVQNFITDYLALSDQEVATQKNDFESQVYGKTLFTIAERIKGFVRQQNEFFQQANQNNTQVQTAKLNLSNIDNISEILEPLLSILPLVITEYPIIWLSLSNNNLQQVPKSIDNLIDLKSLEIMNCGLEYLPESISKLTDLKQLYLQKNKLKALPDGICQIKVLRELDVSANELESLPTNFATLVNLERLNLTCNKLKALPDGMGSLIKLKELNLSGNELEFLPEIFDAFVNLEILRLVFNKLTFLPQSMSKLTGLKELYLSRNELELLPEIFEVLVNLEILNLADNKLKSLPQSMSKLTALKELNLSNNNFLFRRLPIVISEIVNLITLNVSNNKLKSLPKSMVKLTALESLYLTHNNLPGKSKDILDLVNGLTNLNYVSVYQSGLNANVFKPRNGIWVSWHLPS